MKSTLPDLLPLKCGRIARVRLIDPKKFVEKRSRVLASLPTSSTDTSTQIKSIREMPLPKLFPEAICDISRVIDEHIDFAMGLGSFFDLCIKLVLRSGHVEI